VQDEVNQESEQNEGDTNNRLPGSCLVHIHSRHDDHKQRAT